MLVVDERIRVPLAEFDLSYARSSGPGGQNVNKVNSKVTLRWNVKRTRSLPDAVRQRLLARQANRINAQGELVLHAQRFRDQGRNVADCFERLRAMLLEVAQPPRPRRPTRPGKRAVARRLHAKRMHGLKKRDRGRPGSDD